MRLACADDTFRLLEHDRICQLISLLGLEAVDVCVMQRRSSLRLDDVRADPAGWAGRLDERIRGRGLDVADVFVIPWTDFRSLAPNHPDAAERKASRALFLDLLEFAVRLGSPGMTILPGIPWEGEPGTTSFDRAVEELSARVELAGERGVRLSVEAHLGSIAPTPTDALELVTATSGLSLTLDYSHFVYQDIHEEEIHPLAAHARHYHVRGARPGRLQAPLRESTTDIEAMVTAARVAGYEGYLGLEYVWLDWEHCNECDNVAETILLRDRLRSAIAGRPWSYPPMEV
ncbi:MAG: sugar phosphate isomerase/epimerase family protein [Gaiella sp.]